MIDYGRASRVRAPLPPHSKIYEPALGSHRVFVYISRVCCYYVNHTRCQKKKIRDHKRTASTNSKQQKGNSKCEYKGLTPIGKGQSNPFFPPLAYFIYSFFSGTLFGRILWRNRILCNERSNFSPCGLHPFYLKITTTTTIATTIILTNDRPPPTPKNVLTPEKSRRKSGAFGRRSFSSPVRTPSRSEKERPNAGGARRSRSPAVLRFRQIPTVSGLMRVIAKLNQIRSATLWS